MNWIPAIEVVHSVCRGTGCNLCGYTGTVFATPTERGWNKACIRALLDYPNHTVKFSSIGGEPYILPNDSFFKRIS